MEKYSLLVLGWIAYLGLHSVFAADGAKQYFSQNMRSAFRYYRLLYVFFSTIGLFAMLLLNASISSAYLIESSDWNRYFSLILATFSIFIFKAAFKQYSLKGFAGFESDEHEQFRADGILKHVRHPIYSATILMVVGFWLFIPNVTTLISACCIFIYLAIGIPLEEKKLIKKYGEAYISYKQRVPALIPWFRRSS
ncbi:MAG: isoprenylcysteine carboxylmethyltransferase family protein [Cyclobacteriaceae bacterium]|nr:isoprenylcysteine carboxylmethyltransferase family protein [Cyclobacteriaceae bacterium]